MLVPTYLTRSALKPTHSIVVSFRMQRARTTQPSEPFLCPVPPSTGVCSCHFAGAGKNKKFLPSSFDPKCLYVTAVRPGGVSLNQGRCCCRRNGCKHMGKHTTARSQSMSHLKQYKTDEKERRSKDEKKKQKTSSSQAAGAGSSTQETASRSKGTLKLSSDGMSWG